MTLEEASAHGGETVLYSSVPGECEAGVIVTVREHFRLNMADAGFPVHVSGN